MIVGAVDAVVKFGPFSGQSKVKVTPVAVTCLPGHQILPGHQVKSAADSTGVKGQFSGKLLQRQADSLANFH